MSSRRQRNIPLGGRYRQVSLYRPAPLPCVAVHSNVGPGRVLLLPVGTRTLVGGDTVALSVYHSTSSTATAGQAVLQAGDRYQGVHVITRTLAHRRTLRVHHVVGTVAGWNK